MTMNTFYITNLRALADKYESPEFIIGDPSWFMHQVRNHVDQEAIAFLAASISYGQRKQFMPIIEQLLVATGGDVHKWVLEGAYNDLIPNDDKCFYRLYSNHAMLRFLNTFRQMLLSYSTIGNAVRQNATDGLSAIDFFCRYFAGKSEGIIPKNALSPCKRLAMLLRWMVRDNSPVDIGLWTFINKKTLIIPLDTHVRTEAEKIGLITKKTVTMKTAIQLTRILSEAFPDDPTRGDFALFGLGVDSTLHDNGNNNDNGNDKSTLYTIHNPHSTQLE